MKNKRTCEYIAEAIQNEILSGRMEAGQPLRQEELSELLGYSRIPIREALQILEAQGLVRRLATRHVVVADFSEKVLEEIYEMICEVEKKALYDLAETGAEWKYDCKEEHAEEQFHRYIYETITNEFFRRLLETSCECFIRFSIHETDAGQEAGNVKEREDCLQRIYQAYCADKKKEMDEGLEVYYRQLIDNVKKERGFER